MSSKKEQFQNGLLYSSQLILIFLTGSKAARLLIVVFFEIGGDCYMSEDTCKTELQNELIHEISVRNNSDISCNISFQTVWLHDESYETEFRYVIFLNKVIVSRVCFQNRHNGCMTACFEILKKFADVLGYGIIEIQSVETFEMMQWCKKMGFAPREFNMYIKDTNGRIVCIGDYDYKVDR